MMYLVDWFSCSPYSSEFKPIEKYICAHKVERRNDPVGLIELVFNIYSVTGEKGKWGSSLSFKPLVIVYHWFC
jgi:hypothetical protein